MEYHHVWKTDKRADFEQMSHRQLNSAIDKTFLQIRKNSIWNFSLGWAIDPPINEFI